jgi:DNA-binding Lrp family transcriptional regulator
MVRKGLTEKQREIYNILKRSSEIEGFIPSSRQLAKQLGISQPAIQLRLRSLEERGWIKRAGGNKGAITIF